MSSDYGFDEFFTGDNYRDEFVPSHIYDRNQCWDCERIVTPELLMENCAKCGKKTPVREKCVCVCGNEWVRKVKTKHQQIDSEVFCESYAKAPDVWCPKCDDYVKGSFYLLYKLGPSSRGAFHAGSLVTHYRHNHVKSWDRSLRNARYRDKIPNYDYDQEKARVNNRAKRQLLRELLKCVGNDCIPSEVDAMALARGFEELRENDDATQNLVRDVIEKIGRFIDGDSGG